MKLKQKLPVTYLLFTKRGRINRGTYWTATLFIITAFYVLFSSLNYLTGYTSTLILYPFLFWSVIATSSKRLHDRNYSGKWLLLILIPLFGPLTLIYFLFFRRGNKTPNNYGVSQSAAIDYLKNDEGQIVSDSKSSERIINDVTKLNPVIVQEAKAPESIEELCKLIKNSSGIISVGGGRFSMGGQTASKGSLHLDMRKLNHVIEFSKENKTIKVQAGIRWCDIQNYIDEHDLSVKIMQTYANFTVGGALSVNAHGRYMGLGPLILSVKSIDLVLANGELKHATRNENAELFFGSIGCYNAIGIIVQAELELAENVAVKRTFKKMNAKDYKSFFISSIRDDKKAVFHNGDMYPPALNNMRATTWVETKEKPTVKTRLMPLKDSYPIERYFIWAFSHSTFGKWRREHIVDPLVYFSKKIHWRNYEAGYDVAELEPRARTNSTYVLQEYFVPVQQFENFANKMTEIFLRYNVNVINVSIRHALPDSGSYLAWAREEVFAFVVYYKQGTSSTEKNKVGIWTRELIDAVISEKGTYYLPYQAHATPEQFHKAYPNAEKLFELKKKLDPDFRFHNVIWDTYYKN